MLTFHEMNELLVCEFGPIEKRGDSFNELGHTIFSNVSGSPIEFRRVSLKAMDPDNRMSNGNKFFLRASFYTDRPMIRIGRVKLVPPKLSIVKNKYDWTHVWEKTRESIIAISKDEIDKVFSTKVGEES